MAWSCLVLAHSFLLVCACRGWFLSERGKASKTSCESTLQSYETRSNSGAERREKMDVHLGLDGVHLGLDDVVEAKHDVSEAKHDVIEAKHDVIEAKHDVTEAKHDVRSMTSLMLIAICEKLFLRKSPL